MSGDAPIVIELTGAYTSASFSDSSTWGWFNPSKYDSWQPSEQDEFGLAAARLVFDHPTYPVMLGGEWYPELQAQGTVAPSADGQGYSDQIWGDIQAYDLALGQHYGNVQRPRITPWFGATYIRINENLNRTYDGGDPSNPEYSSAESGLWGVMGGADAEIPVSPGWYAVGTVVIRWARGSRDATTNAESPQPTTVTQSDDTSVTMWGTELGVRWDSTRNFHVAAGWRYRDWTYDDGPASFSGPFLRLGVAF